MRKLSRNPHLAHILDPIDRPLLVVTSTGRVAHETPATTALLVEESDAASVVRRAGMLSRRVYSSSPTITSMREWSDTRRQFEIRTNVARYTFFAVPAGPNTLLVEDSMIVDITKHPLPITSRIPEAAAAIARNTAFAAEHALRRLVSVIREMLTTGYR